MSKTRNADALSQITVLELGSTIAGPFCGRLLADSEHRSSRSKTPPVMSFAIWGKASTANPCTPQLTAQ